MDVIRWLLRLPVLALSGLASLLRALWRAFVWLFSMLFGQLTWSAPGWLRSTGTTAASFGRAVRRRPARSGGIAAAVLLLGLGVWQGALWWKNRPHPPEPVAITLHAKAPSPTRYDVDPVEVASLTLNFSGSVAPLDKVGKAPGDGVALQPALAGIWLWSNDRTLTFTPSADWPVGQHYDVVIDRAAALAAQAYVPNLKLGFDSAPFKATVASNEFYQDPQDAALKKAVFQVHFSHPVDGVEFEKRLALTQATPKGAVARKFVVSYDRRKINAYVHSEPLAVPKDDSSVALKIDRGVRASVGGSTLAEPVDAVVEVPGLYSLSVSGMDAVLADNARLEPEQVLTFTLSQAVGEKEAAKAVQAWLLPVYHPESKESERSAPYDWSGDANLSEKILKSAQKLDLEPVAGERDYNAQISFKYRADPGRYVYLRVAKGLESFGGYRLGSLWQNSVRVPDYPQMLRFMADGALLSLGGDKRVAVVARNMPGMHLEIARVLPDQIQHLVAFNHAGTFAKPELGALSPDQISERFEQKLSFTADDPTKPHYEGVDLSHYLGKDKRGVFLLTLTGYDPSKDAPADTAKPEVSTASDAGSADDESAGDEEGNAEGESDGESEGEGDAESGNEGSFKDSRLVVVTDLGTVLKKSLDGSLDIFVQSIHSGAPVADASVEILGKNGQVLLTQASGADGRAHFDALTGFEREKTPTL
ncbi:MAG: alpha-2-macroglobulin family protein, partial [Dokdonella sp.]